MTINKGKYEIALAKSGMSSLQVAELAHITRARLNAIVNQKNVRPETAGKVASALKVDVESIID